MFSRKRLCNKDNIQLICLNYEVHIVVVCWSMLMLTPMLTLKCQPHKMVKHTQTIRWQIANDLFECVRPFCEISV